MPVDFPAIVDRYGPAVVTVMTVAPDQQASGPSFTTLDPDDPLAAFFRRDAPPPAQACRRRPAGTAGTGHRARAVSGSGSGFIVSADGLILTSAHVVDDATDVTVRLTDRREFKATVLAVDPQSDVAVLRVNATKLPFVRVGDSSKVRAGEPVMTIGAPDGSGNTVTAGIVSATSHRLPDGSAFPFFETDIAPNPDNSGGPVFNRAGDVIGIAVQVYTGTDRYARRRSRSRSRLPQRCVRNCRSRCRRRRSRPRRRASRRPAMRSASTMDVGIGWPRRSGCRPGGRARQRRRARLAGRRGRREARRRDREAGRQDDRPIGRAERLARAPPVRRRRYG